MKGAYSLIVSPNHSVIEKLRSKHTWHTEVYYITCKKFRSIRIRLSVRSLKRPKYLRYRIKVLISPQTLPLFYGANSS